MRKLFFVLIALVVVGMLCFSLLPSAQAQSRYGLHISQPIETSGVMTDADGNSMDYPVWLYGVSIYADAASSFVGIYDGDVVASISLDADQVTEIGEATQYDSYTELFPKPVYCSDGVIAIISVGVARVFYGPAPD